MTINWSIQKSAFQPVHISVNYEDYSIPEQILPSVNFGTKNVEELTPNDMKVSHSFRTQFHTLKRYERQELKVLLQGEASEVTGVSLTNTVSGTTFFGHTVDEATSELA